MLKKIKGQIARDKGRGGEWGGCSGRLCVHPTTGQREAGLALLQRNLTQPALAKKKEKKEDFKTPMQACYFEKLQKKK